MSNSRAYKLVLAFLQYFDRLMTSLAGFMAGSYLALFSSFRLLWRENSFEIALFCTTRLICLPLTAGQINYESSVQGFMEKDLPVLLRVFHNIWNPARLQEMHNKTYHLNSF